MSYSFLYTAAALLGLVTPMDQALMAELQNPAMERAAAGPDGAMALAPQQRRPGRAPIRPPNGEWEIPPGTDWKSAATTDAGASAVAPPQPRRRWKPEMARPVRGYTAHLASYLGETWAHRGWEELQREAPSLNEATPVYRHAEVPALGPVVRVTVGAFPSLVEAGIYCVRLKRQIDYCAPLPVYDEAADP